MSAPDAPPARPVPVLGVRCGRAFVVVEPAAILWTCPDSVDTELSRALT